MTTTPYTRVHDEHTIDAHLVVGYDRHPAGIKVLTIAADLAARLRAELHVVHAIDSSDCPIDPDAADWEQQAQHTIDEERHRVSAALTDRDLKFTYRARRGDPVRLLTDAAEDTGALMIIVGSRGEGLGRALVRLLDPAVSHGLIAHQLLPVLVVPVHQPHHADDHAVSPATVTAEERAGRARSRAQDRPGL